MNINTLNDRNRTCPNAPATGGDFICLLSVEFQSEGSMRPAYVAILGMKIDRVVCYL